MQISSATGVDITTPANVNVHIVGGERPIETDQPQRELCQRVNERPHLGHHQRRDRQHDDDPDARHPPTSRHRATPRWSWDTTNGLVLNAAKDGFSSIAATPLAIPQQVDHRPETSRFHGVAPERHVHRHGNLRQPSLGHGGWECVGGSRCPRLVEHLPYQVPLSLINPNDTYQTVLSDDLTVSASASTAAVPEPSPLALAALALAVAGLVRVVRKSRTSAVAGRMTWTTWVSRVRYDPVTPVRLGTTLLAIVCGGMTRRTHEGRGPSSPRGDRPEPTLQTGGGGKQ